MVHPVQRKRPNFAKILEIVKTANFLWFLGFFSAYIDPIELKPFSLYRASQNTSLEYQQETLWSTLKLYYFFPWPPLRGPREKYF